MKEKKIWKSVVLIPIVGTMCCDCPIFEGEEMVDLDAEQVYKKVEEDADAQSAITEYLKDHCDDLAKYLNDYDPFKKVVLHLWTGSEIYEEAEKFFIQIEVETTEELEGSLRDIVLGYLQGQMSDGWGENFITDVFCEEQTATNVIWDEDELCLETEEEEVKVWGNLNPGWKVTSDWKVRQRYTENVEVPETFEEALKIIDELRNKINGR